MISLSISITICDHAQNRLASGCKRIIIGGILFVVAGLVQAQDERACGSLANHYGPFDYRKYTKEQRALVESFHFTPGVETLTRPSTSYFGGDIAYTLHVYPNHHRALITLQRLAEREKTDFPSNAGLSVQCYFDRAIRFQPDDVVVRMLYAQYLIKKSRREEATLQLDRAIELAAEEDPFTHFNVGLIFLEMKNYNRALAQAHLAARLGFTRPELKDGLVAAGKWVEPQAQTSPAKP